MPRYIKAADMTPDEEWKAQRVRDRLEELGFPAPGPDSTLIDPRSMKPGPQPANHIKPTAVEQIKTVLDMLNVRDKLREELANAGHVRRV